MKLLVIFNNFGMLVLDIIIDKENKICCEKERSVVGLYKIENSDYSRHSFYEVL